MPRRQQEGLVHRHQVVAQNLPFFEHVAVEHQAYPLQPHARLGEEVGREGQVRVDAQGRLVPDEVADRVVMPVVMLALGRDARSWE